MISTSGSPAEVKIRLRRGAWEVEVTCPEDKVQQVVESVLASLGRAPLSEVTEEEKPRVGSATCRGLIENLWREGWFGWERNLSDVHEELARRGYNYDKTAVSHALTDLVRENLLTRYGSMRSYRYVQKKPPSEVTSLG